MKKNYKKISDFITLANENVLKEFEMLELKGGDGVSPCSTNPSCTNNNCDCTNTTCTILPGGKCVVLPPWQLTYCTIFNCIEMH